MKKKQEIQPKYEEEIDLMDYVNVIMKRKRFIFCLFLVTVIIAWIFSVSTPKVYTIDTTLEIGSIGEIGNIGARIVEVPGQVVEKINGGIYGNSSGIKVSNPANTNLIKIETISEESQKTKKILEEINESILADHNSKIDAQKNLLEREIERLQEKIDFLILKGQEIAVLQLEINDLQRQKEMLRLTKVIKEPTLSKEPVKPKPLLNIVIAGILGIFIGVFWAFFKEWWEKNKIKS